jgi:hypothetical protein
VIEVPAGTQPGECRSTNCRATIYWVLTGNGKRMPVDCDVPGGAEPTARESGQGVSHFATCADANRFRRGGA